MTTLALPSAYTTSTRPLSHHGMPKPPRVTSPDRPHRFVGRGITLPDARSIGYPSPRSPGPMSPPMSARSFGTIIDSAPSTPAYSPRMDYEWNTSTLVLLRPLSSSSEPSSPSEPAWDMIQPVETTHQSPIQSGTSQKKSPVMVEEMPPPPVVMREMSPDPRLMSSSPPSKRRIASLPKPKPQMQTVIVDPSQEENKQPHKKEIDDTKVPSSPPPTGTSTAPFGKLASKMKLMLRRRSTAEEKQEKRRKKEKEEREKDYYDPVEDRHWSEY